MGEIPTIKFLAGVVAIHSLEYAIRLSVFTISCLMSVREIP